MAEILSPNPAEEYGPSEPNPPITEDEVHALAAQTILSEYDYGRLMRARVEDCHAQHRETAG